MIGISNVVFPCIRELMVGENQYKETHELHP